MMLRCLGIAFVLVLAGCGSSDKDAPQEPSNGARSSPTAKPDETGVFDLETGDCFTDASALVDDTGGEVAEYESLNLVPCDAPNALGIVDAFKEITGADGEGDWPGDDLLDDVASELCGYDSALSYLYPSPDSWDNEDREVVCMTIFAFDYEVGDCVDEVDSKIIDCADPLATEEITEFLDLSDRYSASASYPGASTFDELALEECPDGNEVFLYPVAESWAVGDRELVCLRPLS